MKVSRLLLVFLLLPLQSFSQDLVTAHELRAEKDYYEELIKKERLLALKKKFPLRQSDVTVTKENDFLGPHFVTLEVSKRATRSTMEGSDYNCETPNLLNKLELHLSKKKVLNLARSAAKAEAEKSLILACNELKGKIINSTISFKDLSSKVTAKNESIDEGNFLVLTASIRVLGKSRCYLKN